MVAVIFGLVGAALIVTAIALLAIADNEARPGRVALFSHGAALLLALTLGLLWAINHQHDALDRCRAQVEVAP